MAIKSLNMHFYQGDRLLRRSAGENLPFRTGYEGAGAIVRAVNDKVVHARSERNIPNPARATSSFLMLGVGGISVDLAASLASFNTMNWGYRYD